MRRQNQALIRIVYAGLMAAMIFVVTMLLRIPIPTPIGETQLKLGNVLCLLAGMLFGWLPGGLAAGIGSMLFDLFTPAYTADAPLTFVFFFTMAALCGVISRLGGARARNMKLNTLGAVTGALAYYVLYVVKNLLILTLGEKHMALDLAFIGFLPKMGISAINAVIAVVCSLLLIKPIQKALGAAHVLDKFD